MKKLITLLVIIQTILSGNSQKMKCLWVQNIDQYLYQKEAHIVDIEFLYDDNENPYHFNCETRSEVTRINMLAQYIPEINVTVDSNLLYLFEYLTKTDKKVSLQHFYQNGVKENRLEITRENFLIEQIEKKDNKTNLFSDYNKYSEIYLQDLNQDYETTKQKPRMLFQTNHDLTSSYGNSHSQNLTGFGRILYSSFKASSSYVLKFDIPLKRYISEIPREQYSENLRAVYDGIGALKDKIKTLTYVYMTESHDNIEFPIINYFNEEKFQAIIPGISSVEYYFKCIYDDNDKQKKFSTKKENTDVEYENEKNKDYIEKEYHKNNQYSVASFENEKETEMLTNIFDIIKNISSDKQRCHELENKGFKVSKVKLGE